MGMFATSKSSSSAYLLKSTALEKSQLNMNSKDGSNDEREEGEIIDEYEDIISSDEELSMRQRIQELEAKNAELEIIANISTVYGNAATYDYPKKGASSHPNDRNPLISIDISDEEDYPPAPHMQRISKHRKSVQHSCSRRKLSQGYSSSHRRRKQSSSSPPPAPPYRQSDKLLLSMFHERVSTHSYSSKRKRKSKKSHTTKSSRKVRDYYISDSESDYNFNSYNVDADGSYENIHSSDQDKSFSLNREELQVALARNSHRIAEQQVSLKDRLIRRKENTNTLNEKTAQGPEAEVEQESKPNSPHEKADTEDNMEEQELRIIALKSAVIRKHLVRKKRNENLAYSPSDFDTIYANATASPLLNNIDDADACMEISPVPSPKMIVSDDEGMDTKPVDMDIANSDSDCDLPNYEKWVPIEQIPLPNCMGLANELFVPTPLRYNVASERDNLPPEVRFESVPVSPANLDSEVEEEELALRALLLAKMNSPKVVKKPEPPKMEQITPVDTSLEAETLRQFLISNMKKKTQPKHSSASVLKEAVRRLTARNASKSPAENVFEVSSSIQTKCEYVCKTVEETNIDLNQAIADMSNVKIEVEQDDVDVVRRKVVDIENGTHSLDKNDAQAFLEVHKDGKENEVLTESNSNETLSDTPIELVVVDSESSSNENTETDVGLLNVEKLKDEVNGEVVTKTEEKSSEEQLRSPEAENLKTNSAIEPLEKTVIDLEANGQDASGPALVDVEESESVEQFPQPHNAETNSIAVIAPQGDIQIASSNPVEQEVAKNNLDADEKECVLKDKAIDAIVADIETLDVELIASIVEKDVSSIVTEIPVIESTDSIETNSTPEEKTIKCIPQKKISVPEKRAVKDKSTVVEPSKIVNNSVPAKVLPPPVSIATKPNVQVVTKKPPMSVAKPKETPAITSSTKLQSNSVSKKPVQQAQKTTVNKLPAAAQATSSRLKIVKPNKVINQQTSDLKRKPPTDYATKTVVPTKKAKTEDSSHRLITSVEVPQVKQLIIQLRASDPESEYSTMSEADCDYDGDEDFRVRHFLNRNITIGNEYYDIASPISLPMESPCETPSRVASPIACHTPTPQTTVEKSIVNDFFQAKLDQFLKNVRSKVADTPVSKPIESDALTVAQPNTPVAVRHLPEASQQEYRRLINRMKMLERQKQSKNLQVVVNNIPDSAVLDVGRVTTEGDNKTLVRKVLVKNTSVTTANLACHKNAVDEREPPPKRIAQTPKTPEKCSNPDPSSKKSVQSPQKISQSVPKPSRENLLGLYENSYRETGSRIIMNLDKSIELVVLAKEAKMAKLKHEHRLRQIQKEMEEVQRNLQHEQDKITKMYPNICNSHRMIESLKSRRGKINKAVTALGKSVIGPTYSMNDDQKSIISEKSKKLAAEIKFVNTMKLSDVEKWASPTCETLPEKTAVAATVCNATSSELTSESHPTVENESSSSDVHKAADDSANSSTSISVPETTPIMESNLSDTVVPETELNEENNEKHSTNGQEEALITVPVDDDKKEAPSPQKMVETHKEDNEQVGSAKLQDYVSPLSHLRDERQINPNGIVCPYQLMGQCDDKDCKYMHLDNDDDISNTVEEVKQKIKEAA